MSNILITGILMVALSSIPDIDIAWELKHRGVTHTFLAGSIFGVFFAVIMGYFYGAWGLVMGFIAGFGGTTSHLLGDVFSYHPLTPLYPFSNRKVAFRLFKASNRIVNSTIFLIGVVAFILSYEPAIITQIINSLGSLLP